MLVLAGRRVASNLLSRDLFAGGCPPLLVRETSSTEDDGGGERLAGMTVESVDVINFLGAGRRPSEKISNSSLQF